jgi:hypothetical protein
VAVVVGVAVVVVVVVVVTVVVSLVGVGVTVEESIQLEARNVVSMATAPSFRINLVGLWSCSGEVIGWGWNNVDEYSRGPSMPGISGLVLNPDTRLWCCLINRKPSVCKDTTHSNVATSVHRDRCVFVGLAILIMSRVNELKNVK